MGNSLSLLLLLFRVNIKLENIIIRSLLRKYSMKITQWKTFLMLSSCCSFDIHPVKPASDPK